MSDWNELKGYRLLPPEDIPKAFKTLAHTLAAGLQADGFRLQQSKTQKTFSRLSEDFLQGIYLQNTARLKHDRHFHLYLILEPLYGLSPKDKFLFAELWEIDPVFKMQYPLTQEHPLLAEHLLALLQERILPLLDTFTTTAQVVNHYQQLPLHLPFAVERLIYTSAFRERHHDLFMQYNAKQTARIHNNIHSGGPTPPALLARLEEKVREKAVFLNDALFAAEIERQNRHKAEYLQAVAAKK
ncbi:hypothetical protein L1281_000082 [Neisseria sp. HSC-16F19]|nr:hypothetical protein [Neisseria sp. HSC-16F19]MCP2039517.1 hypothetical protein [Neisseria sp. HSC-16F19]